MKPTSTFQINDTFRITGRGLVSAGNISEGLVSIGDYIVFGFNDIDLKRKITGIESIRSKHKENNCGLMIETLNEEEIDELINWAPNGIQAIIYKMD